MDELGEFISILDAECDVLKKSGLMLNSKEQPWRYYSCPLDDEHEYELLRSVIEAGKYTVGAEKLVKAGDEPAAWRTLAKAQAALLKSLSSHGRAKAKTLGQAKGGQSRTKEQDDALYEIFCIADDLLRTDEFLKRNDPFSGLAPKVADELAKRHEDPISENQVRKILNKLKHTLVNR